MTANRIITTDFKTNENEIKQIRQTVFIDEQHVPEELEWDDEDKIAVHFLVYRNNVAVATARMLPDGHIGRMAVLLAYRRQGIGMELLRFVMNYARQVLKIHRVYLNAQTYAMDFYRQAGFEAEGEEFLDAGIPHFYMASQLV